MKIRYDVFFRLRESPVAKLIGSFYKKEDAEECLYLSQCDEPAPDKHDYYEWSIVEYVEK